MIIRTTERDRYVIISKVPLEDNRLSWKARGLLAYLLSKPDNWTVMIAHLANEAPDGRASVMAGLQELEKAGYLRRTRRRSAGQFDGVDSEIYEEPQEPVTVVRFPDRGKTDCGKSNANEERTKRKNEKDSSGRDEIFEAIVEACGIQVKALTASARGPLNRATKELRQVDATPETIRQVAKAYKKKWPEALISPTALSKFYPTFLQSEAATEPHRGLRTKACPACNGTGWEEYSEAANSVVRCQLCGGKGVDELQAAQ
jgi:hypothetical protein